MAPLLELKDVTRVYGAGEAEIKALDGVNLTIESGEFVAIVGQSGSGKSTLMNILGCLDRPTAGSYRVRGQDIASLDPDGLATLRRCTFGFVFQRYNLLANASAVENVEMPAIYAGLTAERRRARAHELLDSLGVGDRCGHRPNQLSGGQQQRVAVARALMNDAEVILADEPTGALDSTTSAALLEMLEDLNASGRTVILVTHDHQVAERAHRTVTIADGRIVADTGAPPAVMRRVDEHEKTAPSTWLQLKEALKTAFRSLRANIFRTSLTLLGVVIGVSAVVTMLAVGKGSQKQVLTSIEMMGSNLLFARPGAPGTRMRGDAVATLTMEDAAAIAELENVRASVPTRSGRKTLRADGIDYQTSVDGVSAAWPLANAWPMQSGAFFSKDDEIRRAAVVVLGATVADNLFEDPKAAVGRYVFLGGAPFEIAGVLAPKGATAWGQDMDDVALVPLSTGMMRLFGQRYLSSITIAVEDAKRIAETESAAHALLLARHGVEDFQLRNTAAVLESVEQTQNAFSVLLGSVAAISLLVGGIGVMNIMLVSVTERTREIGVRMATGARRSDIMMQFNTEALVVGGLGGAIGVLLGVGVSIALGFGGMSIALTPMPAAVAFSSALAIGLLFGFMPARKASRLDPVAALAAE